MQRLMEGTPGHADGPGSQAVPSQELRAGRSTRIDVGRLALLVGLFTASFDIFMVVNLGGFTLRPYQALLPIALAYAVGEAFSRERMRLPIGAAALVVWSLFIFAFVPNTPLLLRSVGYACWLVLDMLVVFCVVQLFNTRSWIDTLLRWYLASFCFISAVGLLQLFLGAAHLPAPFVKQWMIKGLLPRINGFSYEPSYFVTYILMGWVLSAWLVEQKSDVVSPKLVKLTFLLTSAAMVLATSRLGWAAMMLWGGFFLIRRILEFAPLKLALGGWFIVLNLCAALMAGAGVVAVYKAEKVLGFFAGGTGLFGTPAHSVVQRQTQFEETIALVKKSPFIGYSLGGIGPNIGESQWERMSGQDVAKQHEGMAVFVEVLAASGVIGFIPFAIYIFMILYLPYRLAATCDPRYRSLVVGLFWATVFEFLILQFNQNILRPYVWFQIAIVSAVYAVLKNETERARRA